jgi:FlaA1/EpsC-like NDP-sugar epimerase
MSASPSPRPRAAPHRPLWAFTLQRRTQFLLDLCALTACFLFAYLLRFDFSVPELRWDQALIQVPLVVLVQFAVLVLTGIYSFVWRYIGLNELGAFARAVAIWSVPLLMLRFGLPDEHQDWRVPISVIVMDGVLAFGSLVGLRVVRRVIYERFERDSRARKSRASTRTERRLKRTLLIGAGRAGVLSVREIANRGDTDLDVVGFVDDDPLKQGTVIHGVRVLGTCRDLPRLARELEVDQVVVTIAEAPPETIRKVVEACERSRLRVRTIPGLYEVLQGKVAISRFRDIAMEDLLGRDPVRLDENDLGRFLSGRRVMVTGAAGSIGSELARQIARFRPSHLLLLERAESALFDVDRELRNLWPELRVVPLVGDVIDEHRLRALFREGVPDVIFHAAAHKHVPLMEASPTEALRNNVLGTETLARVAGERGVGSFVLISTDKAVRPSSVMGASKRMAELVVQDADRRYPQTRFEAVRFGNVLGSAGSVIRIFRDQIARGGPVTVTHPDMRRYFMTIPEAAQLVIQAGAMGRGGEIFVLDMGEPVSILSLAEEMIRLSGFVPHKDVEIEFTGPRAGEKLFEELGLDGEQLAATRHPKILIGRLSPYPPERVADALQTARRLVVEGSGLQVRELLSSFLPEARLEVPAPPPRAARGGG